MPRRRANANATNQSVNMSNSNSPIRTPQGGQTTPRSTSASRQRAPPLTVQSIDADIKYIGRFLGLPSKDTLEISHVFTNIEARSEYRQYTPTQKCYLAKAVFSGNARDFLNQQEQASTDTYEKLKHIMIARFDSAMNADNLKTALNCLNQGTRTAKEFIQEIRTLSEKIFSHTKIPVSQDQLMTVLLRGIKPYYSHIIHMLRITNFEEAVDRITHLEDSNVVQGNTDTFLFTNPNLNAITSAQEKTMQATAENAHSTSQNDTVKELLEVTKLMHKMLEKNENQGNKRQNYSYSRGRGRNYNNRGRYGRSWNNGRNNQNGNGYQNNSYRNSSNQNSQYNAMQDNRNGNHNNYRGNRNTGFPECPRCLRNNHYVADCFATRRIDGSFINDASTNAETQPPVQPTGQRHASQAQAQAQPQATQQNN